jgi:hypothetical protein
VTATDQSIGCGAFVNDHEYQCITTECGATSCAGSSTTWDRGIGTEGQLVDGGLYTMLEAICQREKSERRDIQARLLVPRCSSDHLGGLTRHRPYHCSTQARDKTVWLMPNPTTATHSPGRPPCVGKPSMPQVYFVETFKGRCVLGKVDN